MFASLFLFPNNSQLKHPFNINGRFVVDPLLGTVTDQEKNEENRVEQRLMLLLCILSDNAGQVVARETIIKEIWNDYGSADEGLNQAIAVLRKILDDRDKKVIEVIPKKGYVLNASIAKETIQPQKKGTVLIEKKSRKISFTIPLLVILLIAIWLIVRNKPGQSGSPDILNNDQAADPSSAKNQPTKDSGTRPDIQKPDSSAARGFKKQ